MKMDKETAYTAFTHLRDGYCYDVPRSSGDAVPALMEIELSQWEHEDVDWPGMVRVWGNWFAPQDAVDAALYG